MTKTGFIAIVGRPNVGKSTLLNALLGEKVAIVSSKPQTTRNRITGILTQGETQYVFMDTPGMHKPRTKLGDYMVRAASDTIGDVDAAILVVEPEPRIGDIERGLIARFQRNQLPAILVINKTDRANPEKIGETIRVYAEEYDFHSVVPISAMKNQGVDIVLKECDAFMEEGMWFFPDDIATDQPERQIAAEIIREKILRTTTDEIPHGTAVVIEQFEDLDTLIRIHAQIICERDSHKRILIGHHGDKLKQIGTYAREDLEEFFGTKIFLDLWIKVKENWRDSAYNVANFGYKKEDD